MTQATDGILAALAAHGCEPRRSGDGWSARCPAHDDRRPSLSVSDGDDGRALVHCHAGCDTEAVCQALGLTTADLMPDDPLPLSRRRKPPAGRNGDGRAYATLHEAIAGAYGRLGEPLYVWTYTDAERQPVGAVVRWDAADGKEIRPLRRDADGWRPGAMHQPRPLYGLADLTDAERVFVAEGEKCADVLRALGLVATTSAGGSSAAAKADWSPLAGRHVVVMPDHDEAGERYAEDVARLCAEAGAASIRIVRLAEHDTGLPPGADVDDWVERRSSADDATLRAELVALADAAPEWQPPAETSAEADDWEPFPVEALPEPLRGYVVEAARSIGCDTSYAALPLLCVCAAAIGTARRIALKDDWREPAVLWAAIVGESGTLKSPALDVAIEPLRAIEREAHEQHARATADYEDAMREHEAAMARWRRDGARRGEPAPEPPIEPQPTRYIVADATVEALAARLATNPRGLLLARDELAGWVASFDRYAGRRSSASADAAYYLTMHGARDLCIDRKTGAPHIYVRRAALSICGGIQPGVLARLMRPEHVDSGLIGRLLLAYPPRRPKRWTDATIGERAKRDVAAVVRRLVALAGREDAAGHAEPIDLALSAEAQAKWQAWYDQHAEAQQQATGAMAAALAKIEACAARLALVVHLVRLAAGDATASPDVVDADSIARATRLADWFAREVARVYGLLGLAEADDHDDTPLVRWIEARGGTTTARDVQRHLRRYQRIDDAQDALDALVARGRGAWVTAPAGDAGGRPTRRFHLARADKTPAKPEENEVSSARRRVGAAKTDDLDALAWV